MSDQLDRSTTSLQRIYLTLLPLLLPVMTMLLLLLQGH